MKKILLSVALGVAVVCGCTEYCAAGPGNNRPAPAAPAAQGKRPRPHGSSACGQARTGDQGSRRI